ncbi:MAG: PAS domain-containing protein [Desulforhabdus sp.]|nr:PAS domain-containing protein [Desulforhabdus sp.]
MSEGRILIAANENIEATDIQCKLTSLGYTSPDIALTGEAAVRKADEDRPDLVLMDIMLPGAIDGIAAAEQIRTCFDIPVVYFAAHADQAMLQRAKITEPYGYIVKPFGERELHLAIDMALYKHRAEKRLRESEKWLATTLKSIGDALIATDQTGLIRFMNPVAEKLTGWTLEECSNMELAEVFKIINRDTRLPVEDPVAKVIREGNIAGLANHTRLVAKDGMEIPIDDSAAPIKDDMGNIIGVILIFRDITERERAEQALRRSKEQWERTFDSVPDLVAILDDQHRIVRANRAMADRLGVLPDQCIGLHCYEAVHGLAKSPPFCPHSQTCRDGQHHVAEVNEPRLGGDFLVSTTPLRDSSDQLIGSVHVARDITERKAAERKLQQRALELQRLTETLEQRVRERTAELQQANELLAKDVAERIRAEKAVAAERKRFNDVLEMLPAYLVLLTPDYYTPFANRFFRERFGEPRGRRCFEYLFDRSEPCEICETFSVLKTGQPHEWEWTGPDGRRYHIFDFPFTDTDGATLILEMGIDVTEHKRAEEELKESEEKLRHLSTELMKAQEMERKRIAGELHDSVAASLGAVKFSIEKIIYRESPGEQMLEALNDLITKVQQSIDETRRIMSDLRPSMLDDLGIVPSINWFCREFQKTYSSLTIERRMQIEESHIPDSLKTTIFRICQEALNNIAKHSKASLVSLYLQKRNAEIELIIEDNGQGFDLETVRRGLGLSTMKERTELSGGSCSIESVEGGGATVRCLWPSA